MNAENFMRKIPHKLEGRHYGIWLSYNNQEEGFPIPVLPASIEISDGIKSKKYDISGLGEINVLGGLQLTEYSFDSVFPKQAYSYTHEKLYDPEFYVQRILKWMATKRPIRFVYVTHDTDINEAVSIEKFDWKESAGAPGDIEYSLKLRKYHFYAARKVELVKGELQKKTSRANEKQTPASYTIAAGDTLIKIARRLLGDDSRWREIQKLNKLTDDQLKSLRIGQVLKLPT